ncbi:MAG: hypothetical protein Q7P63_15890 [Verrucomicrobiota bacterium JB022]|nr:hypothetical protein [Verrucomicrobiota bacterium JB022]
MKLILRGAMDKHATSKCSAQSDGRSLFDQQNNKPKMKPGFYFGKQHRFGNVFFAVIIDYHTLRREA